MTGIFCPRCKGDMTKRHSARGPFWGCKAFPTCRGTLNVTADGGSDGTTAGIDPTEFPLDAKPVDPATVPARIIALDDEQLLVAAWRSGEAVAAAAAGSGKSTVLVERTADLVREGELPENVLTLTFSRDAASSLRDKLAKRLGSYVPRRSRPLPPRPARAAAPGRAGGGAAGPGGGGALPRRDLPRVLLGVAQAVVPDR